MLNINDIKNHIKSVRETAQITKAMELVSVSKLRKATEKYAQNRRYYERVRNTLKDILNHKGDITHSYLQHRTGQRAAFVVVAGDTGLAGEYNHRLLNFAWKKISEYEEEKSIFIIGQTANEFFAEKGITPDVEFLYCAQDPTLDDAVKITADLVALYDDDLIDEINIIYTVNDGKVNRAKMLRLLPILKDDFNDLDAEEEDDDYNAILEFEPTPKAVFDILVPQYILGLTYSCLIHAVKCEHTERMEAMSKASKNAGEMLKNLEQDYHRARQEKITTELIEITNNI